MKASGLSAAVPTMMTSPGARPAFGCWLGAGVADEVAVGMGELVVVGVTVGVRVVETGDVWVSVAD